MGIKLKQAGKSTAGVLKVLLQPIIGHGDICDALGYVENAGTPDSVVPDFIGQVLFDTSGLDFYKAFGVAAGNWAVMTIDTESLAELALLDGALVGTVVASKAAIYDVAGKVYQSSASPAAAGSTVADATALTAQFNVVTGADGTKGVLLPVAAADENVDVVNASSTSALNVYAITGSQINALGSTVAYVLGPGQQVTFIGRSAILWNAPAEGNVTATATELSTNAGVTAGTVTASKTVVVNANKAVDISRATTERDLGGTGVPGAALVVTEFVKEVTAIADATATAIATVTVPNAAHAAFVEVAITSRLGAGGAIGADEAVSVSKYNFGINRTAGVASVCTASSQLGVVNVAVAGAATVTATLSVTNTGEGVGVTNTHIIKVTITKSGGSSANHKCDVHVTVRNSNVTGVTVA